MSAVPALLAHDLTCEKGNELVFPHLAGFKSSASCSPEEPIRGNAFGVFLVFVLCLLAALVVLAISCFK